jgi:hypothetical protein
MKSARAVRWSRIILCVQSDIYVPAFSFNGGAILRQESNQLRCLRKDVDILVGDLFGDRRRRFLAVRSIDRAHALGRRWDRTFASHPSKDEMPNVWMGVCARSGGEEDGIYPYLVSHRLQARALLRA